MDSVGKVIKKLTKRKLTKESTLWKSFANEINKKKNSDLFAERIENRLSSGKPDVLITSEAGWFAKVELKVVARCHPKTLLKALRDSQRRHIEKYPYCFVLWFVDDVDDPRYVLAEGRGIEEFFDENIIYTYGDLHAVIAAIRQSVAL